MAYDQPRAKHAESLAVEIENAAAATRAEGGANNSFG
jgi:hypothetical protein